MNNYKIIDNEVFIEIRNIKRKVILETVIDSNKLEDLLNLNISWSAFFDKGTNKYYVYGTLYYGIKNGKPKYKRIQLHRFLMNEHNPKILIDHIDRNPLNNKIENLRRANNSENSKNRNGANSNNTSGFRNVIKRSGFWRVQLQVDGKNKLFPEKFEDVHEAGKFAEKMRRKHYGEFKGI